MTLDSIHKRLLDHLKTGVVLLDSNLRLLYINIASEALFEMSDKKAKHLFIGDILINAEEDIGEMQTAMVKNTSFTSFNSRTTSLSLLITPLVRLSSKGRPKPC